MTTSLDHRTLARRFAQLYTGAVTDVLDELGLREQALPHGLLPLDPDLVVAGPAFAIEGRPHPNIDRETSMLAILEMLAAIPRQHVAVYQTHANQCAHLGELS